MNRDKWDNFILSANGSFLQSWAWGEFQKACGRKVWRLVIEEEGEIRVGAQVIKNKLPLGFSYLYIPRGPILRNDQCPLTQLFQRIVDLAREEKAVFVKFDFPLCDGMSPDPPLSRGEAWRRAESVQPRDTLVLDLAKTEEELLASMKQKTRYNIRLAEKKGVEVRFSTDESDLEKFLKLSREVSGRGSFRYHEDGYYREMLSVLSPTGKMKIAIVEYRGEALAASLLISFGDTVTYVHGASGSNYKELMAPYLMQWEAIKRAKAEGSKKYDFYGISPVDKDDHPWSGITRFKEGFRGERVSYPKAYDVVVRPVVFNGYNLTKKFLSYIK